MGIFKWMNKKGCDHDWEVVKVGDAENPGGYRYESIYMIGTVKVILVNRVCIKCGECDNELDRAMRKIKNDKIAHHRRQAWAKQLWEDGCKDEKD